MILSIVFSFLNSSKNSISFSSDIKNCRYKKRLFSLNKPDVLWSTVCTFSGTSEPELARGGGCEVRRHEGHCSWNKAHLLHRGSQAALGASQVKKNTNSACAFSSFAGSFCICFCFPSQTDLLGRFVVFLLFFDNFFLIYCPMITGVLTVRPVN